VNVAYADGIVNRFILAS